ncbi:MAG TPA: phosphoribosylformylglycinamidine synthase, partial [Clostridiaceae bacterium]|nr:phosphoribosylformylglycinamidine synthase [Clostridiaceae bacterium]
MESIQTDHKTEIFQIYVEKKPAFAVEADRLRSDLEEALGISGIERLRIINRYFAAGLAETEFAEAAGTVFAEVTVDNYYWSLPDFAGAALVLAVESLPGQFDQRGDSAAQCIQLQTQGERPTIRTAKIFVIYGRLSKAEQTAVRRYLINPVESREASLQVPSHLIEPPVEPQPVAVLTGFRDLDTEGLKHFLLEHGLAMSLDDLQLIQRDFRSAERRDPTMTEIKVLDTYWSDHCRHTTFLTHINRVEFLGSADESTRCDAGEPDFTDRLADAYEDYLKLRHTVYGEAESERPVCLMDIGTIAMKALRQKGRLPDLDQSPEINACSIKVTIDIDGRDVDYLVMFKNETHNHPTEIEPFGGAATCLGGAIRDPLSGRSYVYQAMRVTGAGNPNMPFNETLPGKLPQRVITKVAADGYSSYGNQIGLATGQVREVYHPGYVAKRMEVGAVIAAAPADQVIREEPAPGDVVLLIGGRTGRDGCGGATGSSQAHTDESVMKSGSEVQKGNPPVERQLQRLFRNPIAARMIKRCNDFGAGGVSVAVGELADGLTIDLDKVPVKYQGLTGTELAISESQERMAVVVRRDQARDMIALADKENLEATVIATVTEEPRMIMNFGGRRIVDLSRALIDSNGASQETDVVVQAPSFDIHYFIPQYAGMSFAKRLRSSLALLNACSQKGLASQFDSTIGSGTVLMPYGGMYQDTPEEGMVARIPTPEGETDAVTLMAYGFDPYLSEWSPYHGAYYAVLQSVAKLTAMGGSPTKSRLSFQEYFPAMR